jgi:hypothetical protein
MMVVRPRRILIMVFSRIRAKRPEKVEAYVQTWYCDGRWGVS